MKKLFLAACASGLLLGFTAQAAYDGSLTLYSSPYQHGNGGEFTSVSSLPWLGTFQTFCLEYQENVQFNGAYDFRVNTGAVQGGGLFHGATVTDPYTGMSMDPLSMGTAWLYSQFRAGTLLNYFTGGPTGTRQGNAGYLQVAFWMLEGELSFVSGNPYVNAAEAALGLNDTTIRNNSNGAFGVVVLNLFNGPGATPVTVNGATYYLNQDELAIVPEPSTMIAGAMLLGPLGLTLIRSVRRKRSYATHCESPMRAR